MFSVLWGNTLLHTHTVGVCVQKKVVHTVSTLRNFSELSLFISLYRSLDVNYMRAEPVREPGTMLEWIKGWF